MLRRPTLCHSVAMTTRHRNATGSGQEAPWPPMAGSWTGGHCALLGCVRETHLEKKSSKIPKGPPGCELHPRPQHQHMTAFWHSHLSQLCPASSCFWNLLSTGVLIMWGPGRDLTNFTFVTQFPQFHNGIRACPMCKHSCAGHLGHCTPHLGSPAHGPQHRGRPRAHP